MPPISLANVNQIAATAGYAPRLNLAESLALQTPQLYADRSFAQQQRNIELQQQAEETRQSQQKGANIISGVGTTGQLGLTAWSNWDKLKEGYNWLTGGTGVTGSSLSASPSVGGAAGSYVTGPAADVTATSAGVGAPAVPATQAGAVAGAGELAATGAPPVAGAGAATPGVLAAAAPFAASAGAGYGIGTLAQASSKIFPVGSTGKRVLGGVGGAAAGAGLGLAISGGNPIAAGIGALVGGLKGGSVCVLHEAGYGVDSVEVQIVRRFRDTMLTREQLRAYYRGYESVAERMRKDPRYRAHIRTSLTDRLVRYGAAQLRIPYAPVRAGDVETAQTFLQQLRVAGKGMTSFTRANGEVI